MSAKHQVYGSPGLPPEPPTGRLKETPRPRWEVVARLIEGTEIRRPAPTEGKYPQPGKWQIGGRYQRLADGSEFDALLTVDGDALVMAEALRSTLLLASGDSRAVETRLHTIRQDVRNDPVSAAYLADIEACLALLLGMEKDNG